MSATHFRSYEFSELLTIHYRLTGALLYAKLFFFRLFFIERDKNKNLIPKRR